MSLIQSSCEVRSFALFVVLASCRQDVYIYGSRMKYQTNHLHTTGIEFRLKLRECTELCGADWSEVCRVGEQDSPFSIEKLVEIKVTNGSLGLEVRS
jgi:hypothetical protein